MYSVDIAETLCSSIQSRESVKSINTLVLVRTMWTACWTKNLHVWPKHQFLLNKTRMYEAYKRASKLSKLVIYDKNGKMSKGHSSPKHMSVTPWINIFMLIWVVWQLSVKGCLKQGAGGMISQLWFYNQEHYFYDSQARL